MKRVLTGDSLVEIGHFKNLLEQQGIACLIKNEQLSGALGEIPFIDCWPELWVLVDAQAEEAQRLIAEHRETARVASPWRCKRCGETIEGQFAVCWQCGAPREED
jgi:hypothetical protein